MASTKEIRGKIASVKSTQKITRAMELVAASKMRKAQERMSSSKPYAQKIRAVIQHLATGNPEYQHPFMVERPCKRVGVILISTDRGLCGGLNINLFKKVILDVRDWSEQGIETEYCLIGQKAVSFFRRTKGNIISTKTHLGDAPTSADLIGAVKVMLDAYDEGKIDRLMVYYNDFVNTMTQVPTGLQLLPLLAKADDDAPKHRWDYIYEPAPKDLLDLLLTRFVETQVYQSVVDNNASEQAARMVAMKAATDNAGGLIKELNLMYNKARQAAITQELSEIVSGAAAV